MSRLRFLSALAVLAVFSAVLVACGGGSADKSSESPEAVLEEATLQGIESGNLDIALDITEPGKKNGSLLVTLVGPFKAEDKKSLPQLDLKATAEGHLNGKEIDFKGGLTLLPNSAYVEYEGTEYEVDPTTFSFVESTLKEAQREGGAEPGAAGVAGCQEEFGKLKIADFLENPKNEGSGDVSGTPTTEIVGDLNVMGAIDSLLEVVESPACRSQLAAAGPLPSKSEVENAKNEVGSSLKDTSVELYVGDDDIVRRMQVKATVEPQNGGSGPKIVETAIDVKLAGVNEEQSISAPENAQPLSRLFIKLGVNPIELLGLLQGEEGGESLGDLFKGLGEAAGQ
jgi:hypothetical protein